MYVCFLKHVNIPYPDDLLLVLRAAGSVGFLVRTLAAVHGGRGLLTLGLLFLPSLHENFYLEGMHLVSSPPC